MFPFAANGRALALSEPDGVVKMIGDAKTGRLLGVHIVGAEASNLIAEATLALEMGASVEDIALTVHAHPTLPETLMEAAEATLGHAVHIFPEEGSRHRRTAPGCAGVSRIDALLPLAPRSRNRLRRSARASARGWSRSGRGTRSKTRYSFLEHRPVITRGRGLCEDAGTVKAWRAAHAGAGAASARHRIRGMRTRRRSDVSRSWPAGGLSHLQARWAGLWPGSRRDGLLCASFEGALIGALLEVLGITAHVLPEPSATGVWVDAAVGARKIASIGIAVRRWVTYHGIALNCVNDLEPFGLISPCGFSPEVMTRVADSLDEGQAERLPANAWRERTENALQKAFEGRATIGRSHLPARVLLLIPSPSSL